MSLKKHTSTKIKIGILSFFLLISICIIQKVYQFQDFSPTAIIDNHSLTQNDNKIKFEFKAKYNHLGTIAARLDATHNEDKYNYIIFRIKDKNQDNWFYENKYEIDPSQYNHYFPFGFPEIDTSQNQIYQVEITTANNNLNTIISDKVDHYPLLSKYNFPKSFLLQNKSEIPKFLFQKFKSILDHVSLLNLLVIFIISLIFTKIPFTNIYKKIYQAITANNHKSINPTQKLIFSFPLFLGLIILILLITVFLKNHTESNEWFVYEISTILTFIGSILFFNFFTKIKHITFKKISIILFLIFSLTNFSFWYIFRLISFRYILLIFILGLLPSIIFNKKNPISLVKNYMINTFLIFNVVYFFIIDIDNLKPFTFITILVTTALSFIFLKKYKFSQPKPLKSKIIAFILFASITIVACLFKKDIEFHHYSFYIGPAYEILHHKSLLNDFPSQYGYLSIHFIAELLKPFGVTFQSFHILNTSLYMVYFFIFFLIYLKLTKNPLLTFILSTVTSLTQCIFSIHSFYLPPSSGFLRFGPGLIIILFLLYLPKKIKIPLTSLISSIALFWSIETAIYVIPAWIFFIFYTNFQQKNHPIKGILKDLLIFLLTSLLIFSLIFTYEYQLTHQIPNFKNYIQFALIYKDGFSSELVPLIGNYYIAITILLTGLLITNYFLFKRKTDNFLNTLSFLSIHNIALFSYFVSRSNQNNLVNIFPFLLLESVFICLVVYHSFKINLYKYLALPMAVFVILFSVRCIQNFTNKTNVIKVYQTAPMAIQQYDLIKNIYELNSQNVIILSKNWDTPIILDNKIETILPLNPNLMSILLPDYQEKYIIPNLNKINIGTTIVTSNDTPGLLEFIEKYYKIKPVNQNYNQVFSLYTIESKI